MAKIRSYIDAITFRRKNEFRREVSLLEWSTRIIAQVTASSAGAKESDVAKMASKIVFPWGDDEVSSAAADDPNDLSYLETGDVKAVERNVGKNLGSLGPFG